MPPELKKILVNGREYADRSAMPPDVRAAYDRAVGLLVDADRNGIPDIVENAGAGGAITVEQTHITVNGTASESPNAMAPDVRALYDRAGGAGAGGFGATFSLSPVLVVVVAIALVLFGMWLAR